MLRAVIPSGESSRGLREIIHDLLRSLSKEKGENELGMLKSREEKLVIYSFAARGALGVHDVSPVTVVNVLEGRAERMSYVREGTAKKFELTFAFFPPETPW